MNEVYELTSMTKAVLTIFYYLYKQISSQLYIFVIFIFDFYTLNIWNFLKDIKILNLISVYNKNVFKLVFKSQKYANTLANFSIL